MRSWPLRKDSVQIKWTKGMAMDLISGRSGTTINEILKLNRLSNLGSIRTGMHTKIPCFRAIYNLESWDTLEWVCQTFGYRTVKDLAMANGLKSASDLNIGDGIRLPDWFFLYAGENDSLDDFDSFFNLPKGSSITVGKAFHPNPKLPFAGEMVAIPNSLIC